MRKIAYDGLFREDERKIIVFNSKFSGTMNLIARLSKKNPDITFENFTPHTRRHTFSSNCIANGVDPKTLQRAIGHGTLQITVVFL